MGTIWPLLMRNNSKEVLSGEEERVKEQLRIKTKILVDKEETRHADCLDLYTLLAFPIDSQRSSGPHTHCIRR
ncbi:hypothetical protein C0J52_18371 [Blattella germanica]|nr:hypothetical protein C0J52_18371 [Blattella germanica]